MVKSILQHSVAGAGFARAAVYEYELAAAAAQKCGTTLVYVLFLESLHAGHHERVALRLTIWCKVSKVSDHPGRYSRCHRLEQG